MGTNMLRGCLIACAIISLSSSVVFSGTVTLELSSSKDGSNVAASSTIDWAITAEDSTGDNLGLALVAVDLQQNPSNPGLLDLPAGDSAPVGMEGFESPAGICNPGPGGPAYGGTPLGTPGQANLVQIGGAQNTFGVTGGSIGQDIDVDPGVGQGMTGQLVATGSFTAPSTPGTYQFLLANGIANVLTTVNAAPVSSTVEAALVNTGGAVISFSVCLSGDVNNDAAVTPDDIGEFVDILLDPDGVIGLPACAVDVNGDGKLNGEDVQQFVLALIG